MLDPFTPSTATEAEFMRWMVESMQKNNNTMHMIWRELSKLKVTFNTSYSDEETLLPQDSSGYMLGPLPPPNATDNEYTLWFNDCTEKEHNMMVMIMRATSKVKEVPCLRNATSSTNETLMLLKDLSDRYMPEPPPICDPTGIEFRKWMVDTLTKQNNVIHKFWEALSKLK
ncbi:unnamed protein product [Cochlearia groenlandica]